MIERSAMLAWPILLAACAGTPALEQDLARAKDGTPPVDRAAAQADVVEVDWRSIGDCRAQLRELVRIHERGGVPEPDDLPFALAVGPVIDRVRFAPPSIPVDDDLPIPINPPHVASAPCLIRVARPEQVEAHWQVVGQEAVASEYQSGVRREDNPEYEILKLRAKQAERDLDDAELSIWQGGIDPLADLVGLLVGSLATGFGEASSERELNEVLMELAKTPRKIDEPVYHTYHFERQVIDAVKQAEIPVEMVDRRGGGVAATVLRQTERRRFYIPTGLHARDRHYMQHRATSITADGLDRWERSPPPLRASEIVAVLLAAPAAYPPGDARPVLPPATRDPTAFAGSIAIDDALALDDGHRKQASPRRPRPSQRSHREPPPGPLCDRRRRRRPPRRRR